MFYLAVFVFTILICLVFLTVTNAIIFPRLGQEKISTHLCGVSVLIPARNEARGIAQTVQALLAQDFPDLEVIMLDDHSEDGTSQVAEVAAQGDQRFQVCWGSELPPGWGGKNWACHQLSTRAQEDWLVFTDADVEWKPGALANLVGYAIYEKADMVTVWPTQRTVTWGERLVVPLIALSIMAYLPILAVHYVPWPVFSAANGQCLLFRRSAYEKIGGHSAIRSSIVEDISLAQLVKSRGLRLRMLDGAGLILCRMYHNWDEVRDGFSKNILAGHANNLVFLGLSTLFHWLVFVVPWLWLGLGWIETFTSQTPPKLWPAWPLILVGLGVGVRAITAAVTRQRVLDAIFMPISVFLMTFIAARSAWFQVRYGGPVWKGRRLVKE
jgi:chlorobactene glucosyltransferase